MSRAGIEQALNSLLPVLNGSLPPELVQHATSLLARSRSVAHSLKPDEEIARPYACAQLACERLKKRLNLPVITSRPPCPPRIYKKLYGYLESALPLSNTSSESIVAKPVTPKTPRTPKTPISTKRTNRTKDVAALQDVPEWIMPAIRSMLKVIPYPTAAPHIFTGVETILPLLTRMPTDVEIETPSKQPRRAATFAPAQANDELPEARTMALVAVILFYVVSRMQDQTITPQQYIDWRNKAVTTLLEVRAGTYAQSTNVEAEIEKLMPMAKAEGWLQMEWFSNVQPAATDENDELTTSGEAPAQSSSATNMVITQPDSDYIGLGTMQQASTDYLGSRQRADYARWKADIMERIEALEAR